MYTSIIGLSMDALEPERGIQNCDQWNESHKTIKEKEKSQNT